MIESKKGSEKGSVSTESENPKSILKGEGWGRRRGKGEENTGGQSVPCHYGGSSGGRTGCRE